MKKNRILFLEEMGYGRFSTLDNMIRFLKKFNFEGPIFI